jgi:nucleoside-triphosphatase THEP1
MDNGTTVGYDLEELNSREKYPFLRDNGKDESPRFRRFYIDPKGLLRGVECLKPEINRQNQVIIIDEVGRMELTDEGWSKSIADLLSASFNHLVMAVRTDFVEAVAEKWHLEKAIIIDISSTTASSAFTRIAEQIREK